MIRGILIALGLPDPPWIVAHRGASADEPENTLASARAALEQGAHMVELDVRMTVDGELLLLHDRDVSPGGRRFRVEESESAELLEAFDDDKRPPTLASLLEAVPETLALNLELKCDEADIGALTEGVLATIGDRGRILVSSFDYDLLVRLRRASPELPLAPIGSRRPHELLRAAEILGATSIHCHRRLAFADFIGAAGVWGWPVLVYTINDATLAASLLERGVKGVFTDRPGAMREELGLV